MFWICHLGETAYPDAFQLQLKLRELRRERKIPDLLLFTSHPPVFTLGKQDCTKDFLSQRNEIEREGIQVIQSNRGGRITYHGPGQVVGYFIVDLRGLKMTIPAFVRSIEELLIRTLSNFGIDSHRDPSYPGVWIQERKVAAIGLHFDRGVSMHGFALNVNPHLDHYRHIVPCGIKNRRITSLQEEVENPVILSQVEKEVERQLSILFQDPMQSLERKNLNEIISSYQ